MKLLLDSHALLWAVTDNKTLSLAAHLEIDNADNVVFVSFVSLWEIRIKEGLGKIKLPANFYKSLKPTGFEFLPVTLEHIDVVGKLPHHHRDPFDRMLVAQAKHEQLTLVTRDREIGKYGVEILTA